MGFEDYVSHVGATASDTLAVAEGDSGDVDLLVGLPAEPASLSVSS